MAYVSFFFIGRWGFLICLIWFFKEFILIWKRKKNGKDFFVFSIFQIPRIKISIKHVHYIFVQILRINFLEKVWHFARHSFERNWRKKREIKACVHTHISINTYISTKSSKFNYIESLNCTSKRNHSYLILLISSTILFFSILPTYEFYKLITDIGIFQNCP